MQPKNSRRISWVASGAMEHTRWHARPTLHRPTLVAAFTGWNDAGDAASMAVRTMIEAWDARPLATIDPEEFTDFASTRPHVRLTGGTRDIVWPTVSAWYASLPGGDVIFVLGPEPSLRWRTFCDELIGLANEMGVKTVVSVGSLLAQVLHYRPVEVFGTATDQEVIDRYDLQRSRYEGPTGIVGVLQHSFSGAGVATMSFWAAVPLYASQVPSPKAALALMERACDVIGAPTPAEALTDDIAEYEERIEQLVDRDRETADMVRRFEQDDTSDTDFDIDEVDLDDDDDDPTLDHPSVPLAAEDPDHLIEEVERFLRDQGQA